MRWNGEIVKFKNVIVCVLSAGFLLTAAFASAQAKPPAKANPPGNAAVDALFGLREFMQAEISPDGKRVAWVESLPGPGGAPSDNAAIYVADLSAPKAAKRITAAAELSAPKGAKRIAAGAGGKTACEEHDLAWSADGKRLAFLSDAVKTGQLQLYVADVGAGPAKQLTKLKGFLSTPGWSPDGKTIGVLFTENATRRAGPLVAETPDEGVVSEAFLEQRLALVDASSGAVRQISAADTYVYEFDWAPDGKRLAITSAHGNGDDEWYVAGLSTIDAASGAISDVLPKPGMQIAEPHWSPDGATIAFIGGLMSDEPIPGGDVFTVPAKGGVPRNLTPVSKFSATALSWSADSSGLLVTGIQSGQTFIARVDTNQKITPIWTGPESLPFGRFVPYVSFSSDGKTTAVVRESYSKPPEVWAGAIGDWKQITQRNAALRPEWGEAKSLRWKTDIGDVQGWLIYPRDFDPAKKYPMVVRVHGGPAWASTPGWPTRLDYYFALPSKGYFLLLPNPRGSYGQGEKFTRANVKDFGYGDFLDIMAGVDEAIKQAPVDPNRLGITGWSYGGYMAMWAVTQTNRFRAAVAGAGLANYLSYYGENKIDEWMLPYFGATVYDDPLVYAKSSPITYIKNVKTPTLVVVGDRDGECPSPQSYEFWHALKTLHVPTQFVIYENEGHEFANPAHSRDVIERSISWFNQYLAAAK
jgi:dipeptidyl aminopeptidase/acylaminoacyl peptidase